MSRFQIILSILAVTIIGWFELIYKLKEANKKKKYALEYLNKFNKYVENKGKNNEAYGWMTHESVKMQDQLGILGIMSSYKPPYANYMFNNYQVLMNMLPDLHRNFNRDFLTVSSSIPDQIQIIREILIRHIGVLEEKKKNILSEIKNPLKAFRYGIQFILLFPLHIINWFGLASKNLVGRFSGNILFRIFSGIVSLIGIISSMIGIVLGWEDFVAIIKTIL